MHALRIFIAGASLAAGFMAGDASAQAPANLREVFQTLDANNDMTVELSEVPEAAQPAFKKLLEAADSNKDGKVQAEEMRTVLQNYRPNLGQMAYRLRAMDENKDGKITKDEFKGPEALFDRLDKNSDGMIETSELPSAPALGKAAGPAMAALPLRMKALDKDGDGKLSKDEFQGPEAFFDRLDGDSDGKLDARELGRMAQGMTARIGAMDANGDGKVSKDEFKGQPAMFDRLDANGDGFLSKDDSPDGAPAPAAAKGKAAERVKAALKARAAGKAKANANANAKSETETETKPDAAKPKTDNQD